MASSLPRYGFASRQVSPSGERPSVATGCGATSPWERVVTGVARASSAPPARQIESQLFTSRLIGFVSLVGFGGCPRSASPPFDQEVHREARPRGRSHFASLKAQSIPPWVIWECFFATSPPQSGTAPPQPETTATYCSPSISQVT